jgi:hypothetical protein
MADRIPDTQSAGFAMGRVLSRAFGAIAANPLAAFGIAFLFDALPSQVYEYISDHLIPASGPLDALTLAKTFLLTTAGMVFGAMANGAFVRLTIAHDAGLRPSFVDALRTGGRVLFPLIGLSLVISIGTTLGLILLIIPGIFLSLMWAVAAPVLVDERCGIFAALGRSRTLTEGAWGAIFLTSLLLGVVGGAFGYFVMLLAIDFYPGLDAANVVNQPFPIVHLSVELLVATIAGTASAAIFTSIYVELRNWKQGTPEDALAEVFG